MTAEPKWIDWAKRLQAIAQNGLSFSEAPFDRERYAGVRDIAAEILAQHSGVDTTVIRDLFSRQAGYATPKVDVRGAAFRDGKILMVREKLDGRWTLPGGWADVTDTPAGAVEREVWEESGFRVRAARLVAVYDRSRQGNVPPYPFHVYKMFFLCDLLGGTATKSNETDEVLFFAENDIPADLSVARVNARQIARLFEFARHPEWPADFD
jgi:ADP-ribose pyrophosphatase YjhB (NUDIX family)